MGLELGWKEGRAVAVSGQKDHSRKQLGPRASPAGEILAFSFGQEGSSRVEAGATGFVAAPTLEPACRLCPRLLRPVGTAFLGAFASGPEVSALRG